MIKTIDECFFQIQNGANIKQGNADGGFPITRIETTANDKFNRDRMGYAGITDIVKYKKYILEDGDLLMSHINSMQYLGRTVLYVKQPNETIIHGMNLRDKYLLIYLNSDGAKLIYDSMKSDTGRANLSLQDVSDLLILLPSIQKQIEFEEFVNQTDKSKLAVQKSLDELETLKKSLMQEYFG